MPADAKAEQKQRLLRLIGEPVIVELRRRPEDDEEGPNAYCGVFCGFTDSTLALFNTARVLPESGEVLPHAPNVRASVPTYLTVETSRVRRIRRCSDPLRPHSTLDGAGVYGPTDAGLAAAGAFLVEALVRRFAAQRVDSIMPTEGADPVEQIATVRAEAVDGAEAGLLARRDTVPIAVSIRTALKRLRRGSALALGPPGMGRLATTFSDAAETALQAMTVDEIGQRVEAEARVIRGMFRPRRASPTTLLRQVAERYFSAVFYITVIAAIVYCICGGVTLGNAVSGPVSYSGQLIFAYAGFLWLTFIPGALFMAICGIYLSSKARMGSLPSLNARQIMGSMELATVILLAVPFVFAIMFVTAETTPRAEEATPRQFWEKNAKVSDERLCDFMMSEKCSGFSQLCFFALNTSAVSVARRADCPLGCNLDVNFLLNLPTRTCGTRFTREIHVSCQVFIALTVIFAVGVLARTVGNRYALRHFRNVAHDTLVAGAQQEQADAEAVAADAEAAAG